VTLARVPLLGSNAVMGVLGCGALLLAVGCTVPVAADLDDAEANRVVALLTSSGVAADKAAERGESGRFRVEVPRDDGTRAASVLGDEGLPAEKKHGVLEALGANSLVPSRTAEHERLLAGVSGDLEHTLIGVDGVMSARVHLAVPRPDPLADGAAAPPSASVLLRHHGNQSRLTSADVQRLVAGAVPGLSPERVTVVLLEVPVPPGRADLVRFGPASLTREEAARARVVMAGVALMNLALVACLMTLWLRLRKLRLAESDSRARDSR
jgi:type III secretion protein J